MSCCCDSSQYQLLGGLLERPLMGDLLAKGSRVRAGFEYQSRATSAESIEGYDSPLYIQEVLTGAMLGSGKFESAFVEVKAPGWAGFQNGYITAMGTTFVDIGDPFEVSPIIHDLIQEYLPTVAVTRRDAVAIDSIPQAQVGKPNVQQVYDPSRSQTQTQNQKPPPPPGECDWDTQTFGDYIACQLGIKGAVSGLTAGATGAILGVGVLTVLAAVLLRR